jgi:uncharacterized protein involved in type VI secretion and phage assembly
VNEQLLLEIVDRLRNRFYGKYRGTVTDVADDGRIKAKVPAVLGDTKTGWCMPCLPYAGDQAGICFIPEKNAGVWIEFEGGDLSYPIWVGCYWHTGEKPARVATQVKVIRSKGGHEIVLDDKDHKITIHDCNENHITLDSNGIEITRGNGMVRVAESMVDINDHAMEVT